ncbi:helix-turn-helix domain-containing protein [Fulvivirga ligni]|uniref:helix-turn-helix domain-containing protein n=1 Tax=Fulvivirga ligni TaxID=2904246 RepID=UPI001F25FC82|nr:AraC family transcriptional regulator [Fulvivirga ligni]UII22267.1 AraC family transcriptional regulator [Fulvivirga ligni]
MSEKYPKIYLYKRIVHAKLFMDEHYDEKIDLSQISNESYFSKFHFIRLFKVAYGKTPHQYLTSVRIDRAKVLLAQNTPVIDTCFQVGFNSTSSFTGLFKKTVGITPSDFQVRALRRQEDLKVQPLQFIPACFASHNGWL